MGVTHTFVSGIADDPAAAAAGQVLPSHWNATHTVNVNLASEVSGVLPVANGGSGTATPSLVAGSNVTVSGTWPNQTIASTGGGTPGGSTTQIQYNNAGAFGGASGLTTTGTELTITSGTKTANAPLLDATQTWNNAAVTFTGMKLNATDTASNAASLLIDLQVGGTSYFSVLKTGRLKITGQTFQEIETANNLRFFFAGSAIPRVTVSAGVILVNNTGSYQWRDNDNTSSGTSDLFLTRKAAASLQLGAADAAAPVAQTIGPQSVVAGTSNTAGANFTIRGSQGTGTGVGGNIVFQTAPAGGSGTAQNVLATQMTISSGAITSAAGTDFVSNGNFQLPGSFQIRATSNLRIAFPSDGVVTLLNWASTSFGRLQFGGTTSSFPALKVSSTILQVRLADDSAYAPLEASTVRTAVAYTVATLPAAGTAGRRAYVTDATAPTFLGALTGGGAVVCPVFDNGTAWVAG